MAQYAFTFPNASGGADAAHWRTLFPLGDMANHLGDSNCAAGRDFKTDTMYFKAKRAIKCACGCACLSKHELACHPWTDYSNVTAWTNTSRKGWSTCLAAK